MDREQGGTCVARAHCADILKCHPPLHAYPRRTAALDTSEGWQSLGWQSSPFLPSAHCLFRHSMDLSTESTVVQVPSEAACWQASLYASNVGWMRLMVEQLPELSCTCRQAWTTATSSHTYQCLLGTPSQLCVHAFLAARRTSNHGSIAKHRPGWSLIDDDDDDDDDVYYPKGRRPREDEEGEESYEKRRQRPGRGG